MGNRKFLSFLLSIVMVVATFFSVSLADEDEMDESKSYTTTSGITLTLSPEFGNVLWTGIEEDDPLLVELAEYGLDKDMVMQNYEQGGVELQCVREIGNDGDWIQIIVFEMDVPSDLNADFAKQIQPMYPDSFESTDTFEYGMVKRAGAPFYKIASQISGEMLLRLNQYSLITGSGRMHQFNFMLLSDPEKKKVAFPDEECKEFDEISESIMRSIKLSDELASDVVTPEGVEAFKMEIGEDSSVYANTSAFAGADENGTAYPLPEGLTITLPPEFVGVLWVGMDENDSALTAEYGMDMIMELYEESGLVLQCDAPPVGEDNGQSFFIMAHVKDAPSDVSESTFLANVATNQISEEKDLESLEILRKGVIHVGDIDIYKTVSDMALNFDYEVHARYKKRVYKYAFVTESGKLYEIEIQLFSDPRNPDDAIPFTDEDLAHMDYLESYIIGSIQLEGKTVSIDAQPYPMNGNENAGQKDTPAPSGTTEPKPASESAGAKSKNRSFFNSFTNFSFPLWILVTALVAILIAGAKASKRREWQEEPLSLDRSKAIQGFAAVAIIVHHLSQELAEQAGAIRIFENLGVLFVGIFFFFSGYGLYTSLKTKENYLKGFLKKRLLTILIPLYMCILIFTVASCICGKKYKTLQLLYTLSGWSLINQHMWYIVEIAILYLAFFLFYRLIKNRTAATVAMGIFVIAMMTGSLLLAHGKDMSCSYWFQGEWWYNSSFLFVIGIIYSKHADGLRRIARKGYVILLPVFAALTALLGMQNMHMLKKYSYWSEIPGKDPAYLDKIRCLSVQLPWIIVFVCFLLLLMMKVKFGNPVLKFLGSISLELYLIHNLFLTGLRNGTVFKVTSPGMYCILTILMAVGFATIISGVDKYLIALITGKKTGAKPSLQTSSHIHSIDVMRIVMAFLVVAIHLPFAGKAGDVFITYGKTAVPFFLVICGYFLYREGNKAMMQRLLKQTKRILIFFVAANLFYAGFYAIYLRVTEGSFKGMKDCFARKALTDFLLYNFSPFSEHLWYLGSLLYALVILLLLNKFKVLKYAMFTAPLLVGGYVVLSHLGIGEGYQLRNAILVGLGYTMMGMLIRRYEKKILDHKTTAPVLWILFIICCATAIVELNHYKQGVAVPFVSCEILVYVIVLLCLKYPDFGKDTFAEWLGRECSLTVYILHIAVMYSMTMTRNDGFFGRYGAVTVFVITTVIAALYKNIKNAITDSKGSVTEGKNAPAAQHQ